ncbi:E3 ubiquitin-protein ligase Mdm2-like [Petromyzon marinus]|uniref:E3 ubiquitin-protein ligase Mdm2-like n=1 Tax=Petromyzon marinus TaxID=7757 RepID=UPI003F6F1C86
MSAGDSRLSLATAVMSAGDSRLSLAAAGAHRNILLKPVPAMLRLLQSVGVEGDTFTWEQAHHYVGQYIKRRQLYDVERPYLVRCGGDPLGEVFGVEGFSLRDPRHSVAALFVKSFSIVTADSRRGEVPLPPPHSLPPSHSLPGM